MNTIFQHWLLRVAVILGLLLISIASHADNNMAKTNAIATNNGRQAQMQAYRDCIRSEVDNAKGNGRNVDTKSACRYEADALIEDLPSDIQQVLQRTEQDIIGAENSRRAEQQAAHEAKSKNAKTEADYPRGNETVKRHSVKLFSCINREKLLAEKEQRNMNVDHCPEETGLSQAEVDAVITFAANNR